MIDSFDGEYRFLSNFYTSPITIETDTQQLLFPTVEHAYQAMKSRDPIVREFISKLPTSGAAKREGQKIALRSDWEDVKLYIMYELVKKKFTIHKDLRTALISTWDIELVEGNRWGDRYWGVCGGVGQNHLGKILMRVRDLVQGNF